jgi:transglutaminase-like putative cysteine protease
MKKIGILIKIVAFLILVNPVIAAENYNFRDVSVEALKQTEHPRDPEAEAAVLYQSCIVTYNYNNATNSFEVRSRHNRRIKIYTQDGVDWANINIFYHADGNVARIRASTFNMAGGKVEETRLNNRDIHTEDISEWTKNRTFAMPAVVPGSIIDIEFEVIEPARYSIKEFWKKHSIPLNYSLYQVEIPEYFIFNKEVKGVPVYMDIKRSAGNGTINLHQTQRSVNRFGTPQATQHRSHTVTYRVNIETYVARDVPALRDEPLVPAMHNYRTSIAYELSSIRFPGQPVVNVTKTWDDIAKLLMESQTFGRQLNVRTRELEPLVEMAKQLEIPERVNKIYYYVRDNFTWNGLYGEHAANGIRQTVSEGGGNVGDINLLLINLLRQAGVDAKPVVLSSRHNGYLNVTYPTYSQLNYVIAAVEINGSIVFLDATAKHLMAGYLPPRALNLYGIMINNDNSAARLDIYNPNNGSFQVQAMAQLNENMKMSCRTRMSHSGYYSVIQRARYSNSGSRDDYIDYMHNRYPRIEVADYQITGEDCTSDKVTETMELSMEGFAEQINDMVYISPLMIWQVSTNPFTSETRDFPVFYDNTGTETYTVTITIPDSWVVESVPEPIHVSLPDELCIVFYQVNVIGNNIIQVHYRNTHNESIISPEYYELLREFTNMIIEKQNEKIVLRRT